MKKFILLLLALCMLTGCSLVPGTYYREKDHRSADLQQLPEAVEVKNKAQLADAILDFIKAGREQGTIRAVNYRSNVEEDLVDAVYETVRLDPVGAYAVDYLNHTCVKIVNYYEIRLDITYRRTAAEVAAIQPAFTPEQLRGQVERSLLTWDDHLALQVTEDQEYDIEAIVENYCAANPGTMVEIPKISVSVYPEQGSQRIVSVDFLYTHTTDELAVMKQALEESVFAAAEYIRYRSSDRDKTTLLYTYLTQRFAYEPGTTNTPVYSALCEGVADPVGLSRGFALICSRAGVDCHTVTGLLDSERHSWNIVSDDGDFRHIDLTQCILTKSGLRMMTDWEMNRYYWNTGAYPACVSREEPAQTEENQEEAVPEETVPEETTPEETEPEETPAEEETP